MNIIQIDDKKSKLEEIELTQINKMFYEGRIFTEQLKTFGKLTEVSFRLAIFDRKETSQSWHEDNPHPLLAFG